MPTVLDLVRSRVRIRFALTAERFAEHLMERARAAGIVDDTVTCARALSAVLLLSPNRSPLTPRPSAFRFGSDPPGGYGKQRRGTVQAGRTSDWPASRGRVAAESGWHKKVGSKTFRLVAGEWLDSAYDPNAVLPVVEVSGTTDRRELLVRIPELAAYADIGDRVTVVHEGTVYKMVR